MQSEAKKKYKPLDLSKVKTSPISDRETKVDIKNFGKVLKRGASIKDFLNSLPHILAADDLRAVAKAIAQAKKKGKAVILGIGAHVIKCGLSELIIELMEREIVSVVALNGAGAIHDFEIALVGRTSEDVAKGIKSGKFGMVKETGTYMNEAIKECLNGKQGIGEALGKKLIELKAPHNKSSILARGAEIGTPVTVFVAIGTDTIHMHNSMDGKATGEGSFTDFKIFSSAVADLNDGGVYLNIGSTVILPEVFLKALNLARNLKNKVENFTTANFDIIQHYRPRENVVKRPTEDGGKGYTITGHHEIMIPLLVQAIIEEV